MHKFTKQNQSPWIIDLYNQYFAGKNDGLHAAWIKTKK